MNSYITLGLSLALVVYIEIHRRFFSKTRIQKARIEFDKMVAQHEKRVKDN